MILALIKNTQFGQQTYAIITDISVVKGFVEMHAEMNMPILVIEYDNGTIKELGQYNAMELGVCVPLQNETIIIPN